jgi:NAD+ kinase
VNKIKAGIFLNTDKDKSKAIFNNLKALLNEYDAEILVVENGRKFHTQNSEAEKLKRNCDVVFSVGGDGTLLAAQRLLFGTDINIIGINAGRRGFLIEFDESSMEKGLNSFHPNGK